MHIVSNVSLKKSLSLLARLKWDYLSTLKGRLLVLTLGLSLTLLWGLVFFTTAVQQQKFSEVLFDQQFATARRLAADLDDKLEARISLLTATARGIPDHVAPPIIEAHLAHATALHRILPDGVALIGMDGRVIADYPVVTWPPGRYVGNRDYFKTVVETGQPYISKPRISRILQRPVLVFSVPVLDRAGKIRAVLAGITDLTAPNFLGAYFDKEIESKQQFHIVSPHDNLILAATDSSRIMTPPPAHGVNPLYDRFVDGFKGSGIVKSSSGSMVLSSASYVPRTNWLAIASMPADVAFKPVTIMRHYLIGMAAIMTLAAAWLARWITRRMLVPLNEAGKAMQRMTQGDAPLVPLPVNGKDEVGGIINNFNTLVEDRHRNEAALARSEQRFRALFENAPDAIYVCNRGCFAYANAATLDLFGAHSQDQLLGHPILGRVHPDLHGVAETSLQSVIEAKESVALMEVKLQRMDGSVVYARISAIPFHYENEPAALVFARDITQRIHAEKALRESEERFRRLVALSSEWYWEHDKDLVVTTVAGWKAIKGGKIPEYFIGQNPWEMRRLGSDAASWKKHRTSVEARLPFTDFEYTRQLSDGSIVWYGISGEPMFDEDGTYKGYRGTGKDITERKLAEEALRQSRARIRELAAHQETIKEQERKRIARDLHDELGQTLLAIKLDAATFVERTAVAQPALHSTARLMLNHIDLAMKSVKAVINDLRPFVLDLGLVAAMEWQVNEFQRRSGIECVLDVDDEDVDCQLDEVRSTALFRVLQESLTNIVRHAKASHVHITICAEAGQLVMTIADDGIGIALNQRRKKRTFGLVGIEERIKAIGGTFAVDSAPGKGATLTFAIPLPVSTEEATC
ncbi:PAS domain S-box protein [Noviherbaspirillum sedimenti]|uniref:histidine kinase n=1 Tax=Noviherbaspirillum sedimenti TaxID=2320865 RepID=A0A3A3G4C4_9BURK|nr:PAS domain S-box protein [Noviherbaspirillum sedimenti]RJG03328.1 PAS domain S-box protein [Noviherbaspirillum sedimenti]